MKKLATKLTPAIKAWIEEEFNTTRYEDLDDGYFHWHNSRNIEGGNLFIYVLSEYTEVSEQEFLAKFGKKPKPIIQVFIGNEWMDCLYQEQYRIKPTPNYSKEIEALQNKAKENNQKVTIIFE